jgi:hypothetical protein
MAIVRESIEFQRGQDPKRAMGIGKAYDIWREEHNGKPFILVKFFLKDHMDNKKRYIVELFYESDYDDEPNDSIWWGRGKLISAWQGSGGLFSVGNMQNKPSQFFEGDSEERMMWTNPSQFNKEVIDHMLNDNAKGALDHIINEWWECDFEIQFREWFDSGVMTVFNIRYDAL